MRPPPGDGGLRPPRRHGGGRSRLEWAAVVAVLVVLAAVVVVNVTGAVRRGGDTACQDDVHTVQAAIDAYRNDHDAGGQPGPYPNTGTGVTDWSALTDGGAPYLHAVPAACSSYDIDRTTFSVTGHLDGQAYR